MKVFWFGGVAALLMLAGCEPPLPKVTLQDGRMVQVKELRAGEAVTVPGNPSAARLSEREARKVRPYTLVTEGMEGLAFSLSSYERTVEGGNYTRFLLTVTNVSQAPLALDKVYAAEAFMPKDLKGYFEKSGNTDGAVLVFVPEKGEERLWFAIEHPMARYEIAGGARALPEKRTYTIADLTNAGERKGCFLVPAKVTEETVSVTLQYTGGNLKALYSKVEALDLAGRVLSADTHAGESGNVSRDNVYTLSGLTPGSVVVLRAWTGTDGEGTSNGTVTLKGMEHVGGVTFAASPAAITAYVPVNEALAPGETIAFSAVVGSVKEASQLRRVFNLYLNAERAHPYRVLPHYNSWYDLCINRNDRDVPGRFSEAEALASMRAFREELYERRGVFVNSYLWDDGWDDWNSLWGFNANFPEGFKSLADEAHKVPGASIGCWMSPFGGYGGSFGRRLAYAKQKGYVDANAAGLQFSKPVYYAAFRDRVLAMIRDYGMNLFKFDRMGSGSDANGAAARYTADLRAVGKLCGEMRAAKQEVFINCTVGTWASPYWLMWCDSIWKGDGDCDGLGNVGTARQKWVTYRDNVIHDRFASKAPLFPLNSLMMHGIIVCKSSPHNTMRDYKGTGEYLYADERYATPTACADFAAEVWMGVALGTGLQEYYITPGLMSKTWWDILAEGVKWIKANETTLVDVHWIGGDPADGPDMAKRGNGPKDIYGYAALGKEKGIVILRNPSAQPQVLPVDLDGWLEMPKARQGSGYTPTVVFNSTTAYENAGKPGAFVPIWPKTTAERLVWTLPPFTTFLFEVNLEQGSQSDVQPSAVMGTEVH